MLESSRHSEFAVQDFQRVKAFGMDTIRTAVAWPFIETDPGVYDFQSVDRYIEAAQEADVELVFDLLHFGFPDHVDIFSPDFRHRFADFALQCAKLLNRQGLNKSPLAPVNEISFLSWAGGDKAAISPLTLNRGHELKRNLVRAAVLASEVLLSEMPGVRLLAPEPAIHIVGDPEIPGDVEAAADYTMAQFQAWDMLSGRLAPELGGAPEFLDVIGVNFYERNEWLNHSTWIPNTDARYRHLSVILQEVWERYKRPIVLSETGTEDERRANWFEYVCDQVDLAIRNGVPIHGICLYPIANHPGWDDDRHCHNGLFDYADNNGNREVHQPLAEAILSAQTKFANQKKDPIDEEVRRPDLLFPPEMGFRVPTAATPDEPVCTEP